MRHEISIRFLARAWGLCLSAAGGSKGWGSGWSYRKTPIFLRVGPVWESLRISKDPLTLFKSILIFLVMGKENNTQRSSVISWKLPSQSDLGPELSIPGRGLGAHQASAKGGSQRERSRRCWRHPSVEQQRGLPRGPPLAPNCAPRVLLACCAKPGGAKDRAVASDFSS